MRPAAFLVQLFLAIFLLVGAMFWTRLNRRPDVPPYNRRTRSLDVTLHPERYAQAEALRAIRALRLLGTLFLGGAVAVLVVEAFS